MSEDLNVFNLFGDVLKAGLVRKANQLKGIPTTKIEELGQQATIRRLNEIISRNPESAQDQLNKFEAWNKATQRARLEGGQTDVAIATSLIPVRGALQRQADDSYSTRLQAETGADIKRLGAKADLAKGLVLPAQQHEMALANLDANRHDAVMKYAQGENAADRALMERQIADNKTMRLLNSILGAGAFAAAMFA